MERSRSHVVETISRRVVADLLPADLFVERDQTERDYGIDMTLECFTDGDSTGSILLLQVKGADAIGPSLDDPHITFDMSIKALRRVERFVTPVLLVWCPIRASSKAFWYIWLQDYIQIELEARNPTWREQRSTVRVRIPAGQKIDENSEREFWQLRHIADYPKRLAQFGQLSRIAHEVQWVHNSADQTIELLREALSLDAIFGDADWNFGQMYREYIERGIYIAETYLSGRSPTSADYERVGIVRANEIALSASESRDIWLLHLSHHTDLLSTACAMFFDLKMKRGVWANSGA